MEIQKHTSIEEDAWQSLKKFTAARIALGKTGVSIPLKELLQFRLAHANARDAVFSELNEYRLKQELEQFNLPALCLHSKAVNRDEYLQQPGLGRQLNETSVEQLKQISKAADIVLILADGLCATAINEHAVSLLQKLLPKLQNSGFTIAPIIMVQQARVAIGDEAAMLLQASFSIVLIGERPGLSSPDSLGVYLTYAPKKGLTDESRNCISNIRPGGLDFTIAAEKIQYLVTSAFRLKYSGVQLKDNAGLIE